MGKYFILKEVQMNGELLLGKLKLFTELFHLKALLFSTILESRLLVDYEIVLIFILITKSLVTLIKDGLKRERKLTIVSIPAEVWSLIVILVDSRRRSLTLVRSRKHSWRLGGPV